MGNCTETIPYQKLAEEEERIAIEEWKERSLKKEKENKMNFLIKDIKKTKPRKKNIKGNFKGKEDIFFKKIRDGLKKFLESPFK